MSAARNSNRARALRALRALETRHLDGQTDLYSAAIDLATDLRHLCAVKGWDYAAVDRIAEGHFATEYSEADVEVVDAEVRPNDWCYLLRLERDARAWTTGTVLRWTGDGWDPLEDPIEVEGPHPDGVTMQAAAALRARGQRLERVARPGQFARGRHSAYRD